MKSFGRFVKKLHPLIHRGYLLLKPAYWRLRTPTQRRFDKNLQYIFIGCLVGVLLAALVIPAANKLIQYRYVSKPGPEILSFKEKEEAALTEDQRFLLDIQKGKIIQINLQLNKNETLSGLLKRAGMSMADALSASKALGVVVDPRKLWPGEKFELFFSDDQTFLGLKMETRSGEVVSAFKDENGTFVPESREGKILSEIVSVSGVVEKTFSASASKAGLSKNVIQQVIQALDGEFDFASELKSGTPFRVIYEKKVTETGREIGKGVLLHVTVNSQAREYKRYYYVDKAGNQGFYNEFGESAPKTLMKRPLGNRRISSPFGLRRHPILKYQIFHAGVDFPAPTGTPIPASADGVIVEMGRKGSYGKYVRIKHTATYSTAYGHMYDYNDELRVGSSVKRGEIIGYVGNTGRSTGPHLHYEVLRDGKQVNPLNTYTIPKRTLKGDQLKDFIATIQKVDPTYIYVAKK